MELRQLRYAREVARQGSFTRAAARLYLSQPSLSVQIRKLEAELGVALFERLGRRVVPTAAGEALLDHAGRALAELEWAREEIAEVKGLRRGRVSVGVLPSVGARLLPRVLASFKAAHPGVDVRLVEQDVSGEFERVVRGGDLDMAVIRMPPTRPELRAQTLVNEPMVALLPADHRLAGEKTIPLADLAADDFVGMKPGYGLRELMDRTCARSGFTPRVTVETGQLSIVWGLVRAGIGVSVLPRLAAGSEAVLVGLDDPGAQRALGVVWRPQPELSPAGEAFLRRLVDSAGCYSEAPG